MIGARREPPDDRRVRVGIDGRSCDDLLEQRAVDAARARERREQTAGGEELQRKQVDVLVRARRAARMGSGRRE